LRPQPVAPAGEPGPAEPQAAQPQQPAGPKPDGEQPTEVMRQVDGDAAKPAEDGSDPEAGAVAHPSGERREP
jgi:hypothetical protein